MAALETHERPCVICGVPGVFIPAVGTVSYFCAKHERQWACSPQYARFIETAHGEPRRETMVYDFANIVRLEELNEVDKGFEVMHGVRQPCMHGPHWRNNQRALLPF